MDAVGCTTSITSHTNRMAMAAERGVHGSGRGHRIFRHPDAELGPVQLRLSIRPMALPKTCRSALSHIPLYGEVFTFACGRHRSSERSNHFLFVAAKTYGFRDPKAKERIAKTTRLAEQRKVSVLCLGALNKAEWMNNGVLATSR